MNIRKVFLALACGASICPIAYAGTMAVVAPPNAGPLSVPAAAKRIDAVPVFDRMKAAAAIPVRTPPWNARNALFVSRKSSPAIALTPNDVAPPVAGCTDITVGSIYSAGTADPGFTDCFEFVTTNATKYVGYVANLPAGEEHDVHLVQVNTDGTLTYLDDERDVAQNKVVEAIPSAPVRLLLLVDSQSNVPGGATFLFQVLGTTGYDSYEPNDSILHPTPLSGYQQINANLDSSSDLDYYTITLPPTQTSNELVFGATTGTQTAELETSPGAWATLISGTHYTYSTAAGAALNMRVYDTGNSGIPATPPTYSLRVSDAAGQGGIYQLLDTENISHLVPDGENISRTVVVGVEAWDHTGNIQLPPGEPMVVQAYDLNGLTATLLTTTSGVTGTNGNLLATLNIGTCQGGGVYTEQFQTTSSPADHYSISYNPTSYVVAYPASNPPAEIDLTKPWVAHFIHICSETYLGHF